MRHLRAALILLAALPLAAAPAAAQGLLPFTLEGRAGVGFPIAGFRSSVREGLLAEATAKYSPIPFLSAYAGWGLAEFGAEDDADFPGVETKVRDSGLRLGGELNVPLMGLLSGVAAYLQAGATFHRAEARVEGDESGTLGFRSDRTRGLELASGARVGLTRNLSLTPEARYRRYEPNFDSPPPIGIANEIEYIAVTLGLTLHF